jgi:hypothetical protein
MEHVPTKTRRGSITPLTRSTVAIGNIGMVQNTPILGNTDTKISSPFCEEKTKNHKE